MLRSTGHRTTHLAAALTATAALLLGACGGDDAGSGGDDSGAATPATDGSDSEGADAEGATTLTISGVVQLDIGGTTSTNCPYVEDATQGRVYLNPVGDFEGLFSATTDGSDPEYQMELVATDGTVIIEKGTTVAVEGTTEISTMRCTQGDETEIEITSIEPAG